MKKIFSVIRSLFCEHIYGDGEINPFVDEYGMEFDYEKQSITFYDAHPFELFNDKIRSSKSSTKTIILINIILLVISSINLSIKC